MSILNQKQAVFLDRLHGTLLVLIPAGTGKTGGGVDRLADAISAGMPPEPTPGITFTNCSADHMRGTFQAQLPHASRTPTPRMISVE